jgi:8-oxo-dGTP diphosphatase
VDVEMVKPVVDNISSEINWHDVNKLPKMILDHNEILNKAIETLKLFLNYKPLGLNLLPQKFTMHELQKLYETILGRKLDRRNFIRKITNSGILLKLGETKKEVAHKAPNYYSFDKIKYNEALKLGMGFDL